MTESQGLQMTTNDTNTEDNIERIGSESQIDAGSKSTTELNPKKNKTIVYPNTCIGKIEKWFKLRDRDSTWLTEIRAGFVTFVTMGYILSVNANILSDCGLSCPEKGLSLFATDPTPYLECVEQDKLDLVTATAASSAIGTFIMGMFANMPLALAPGMGINAYFAYTVVGFAGTGKVNYSTALMAVFIEGWIFLLLAVTGLRVYIAKIIPTNVKHAITVGIGLFLAHIGLQSSNGIGFIVAQPATKVTYGACGVYNEVCPYLGGYCGCEDGTKFTGGTFWVGLIGFFIISILAIRKVKGGVMIGILLVSIFSWIRGTPWTYFPNNTVGDELFNYFKQVATFRPIKNTGGILFKNLDMTKGDVYLALFTFLYVDLLDTTGTLYSMASFAGMLDKDGNFEGQTMAFSTDAIATVVGSTLGTSPVTTFVESGSGINEGGKTGITSLVTAFLFFLSLFFSPIFASIPPWATGPALIVLGVLMAQNVVKIDWNNMRQAIPSFMTLILMPLTYSIAMGIIGGLICYFVIWISDLLLDLCKCCKDRRERIEAEEKQRKEQQKNDEIQQTDGVSSATINDVTNDDKI